MNFSVLFQTVGQLALLALVAVLADQLVAVSGAPVPSSVAGILGLYIVLHAGLLRVEHIERGAALLVRHLGLFFVPIAVGLLAYRDLLAAAGLGLLTILVVSAGIGILVAGLLVQLLKGRRS